MICFKSESNVDRKKIVSFEVLCEFFMDKVSGSLKKVVIGSLMVGFSSFSLNSKADIYEAFFTGSGEYDDATFELGLQDDASRAFGAIDFGINMGDISPFIINYRGESFDLEDHDSIFFLDLVSSTQFQLSDHTDIEFGLTRIDLIGQDLFIVDMGRNELVNIGSNENGSWTLTSFGLQASDTGDAAYSISGTTAAGSTLTASVSTDDPDGNGTVTSYTWESSSDGSTGWTTISSGTESTYTLTSDEEGKYIRVTVAYTDGSSTAESVSSTSVSISQLHTEWIQPYAAMQNVGLKSIHNNRDLVLEKAGECNANGWVIGDSDYCLYTNANNVVSYVNGDSTKGSYGSAVFNSSLNLEKTLNDKWKAGIAYGQGTANFYNFNFSGTTANLNSSNNHYSIYGVKKVNDTFTLKGMLGGSVFDYKGKRNYLTTAATSSYESDGYTAEISGTWDIKKTIKNMKTPVRLKPTVGVAYAAHTQDGFSESGSGDLITVDANKAESLLFKTGISIDKQIPMEGGKWLLVPSLALNYEMDTNADDSHRSIKGGLTESSTEHTSVSAKTFGQHNGSLEVGADFVLTKDFMFNLKAEYGLAEGGDEHAYGGGFRWQF